jgi:hypothetical protein
MKKRTLKRMTLTKETLLSLDDRAMQNAAGGFSINPTCNASCITDVTRQCSVCNPCIGTTTSDNC